MGYFGYIKAIIVFTFPFMSEMILHGVSVKDALKSNKRGVAFLAAVIISFSANVLIIPNYITVSAQYLSLKKDYIKCVQDKDKFETASALKQISDESKTKPEEKTNVSVTVHTGTETINSGDNAKQNVTESKATRDTKNTSGERYKKAREDFEKMKKSEETTQ